MRTSTGMAAGILTNAKKFVTACFIVYVMTLGRAGNICAAADAPGSAGDPYRIKDDVYLTGAYTIQSTFYGFYLTYAGDGRITLEEQRNDNSQLWEMVAYSSDQYPSDQYPFEAYKLIPLRNLQYYLCVRSGRHAGELAFTRTPLDSDISAWEIHSAVNGVIINPFGDQNHAMALAESPDSGGSPEPSDFLTDTKYTPAISRNDYHEGIVWTVTQVQENVILRMSAGSKQYYKNGREDYFDTAPFMDASASQTMIPIRLIAEAFGAQVIWDSGTRTSVIVLDGHTLQISLNQSLPDGMGAPVLKEDRLFVPLRYAAEQLGAAVSLDYETQTAVMLK